MSISSAALSRTAGVAAVAAGLIFIGVQVGHPHLDAASVTTTEVVVRNSFKVVMAALALVGITGMYLRQVRQTGVAGLVGYMVICVGYLMMMSTAFVAAYILPAIAGSVPGYVDDVTAAASGRATTGDLGLLESVLTVQDIGYLAGGLVFGIALFRARVFPRWASALLAVGGLVTVALSVMPDAFYRLLAFPNGVAMVALGYSLWRSSRADASGAATGAEPLLTTAGAR